jgi:leukotriene-A4 hydrolase
VPAANWSPQGLVHFINSLDENLSMEQLLELDTTLGLSDTRNAEIGRTWFIQVAKRQYRPSYEKLDDYLNRFGRTRLVKPVYQALVANGTDGALARELFENARGLYHPITISSIELILK